ncbi:MAG: DegT/DnrJ/EryC1/StrS family aminotransferase [Marinilabilia sp.]
MVDLTTQYHWLKPAIDRAVEKVFCHGRYINGPEVETFSRALSGYLEGVHVIPCGNGTDALQAALMAIDPAPGDEVIMPAFSFVSPLEVVVLLGLKPVLVDVDPQTYNIDPHRIKKAITDRTRAIIPVHMFGQSAPMEEIMAVAREAGLWVIEDGAQSMGGRCLVGGEYQKLGTIGHIGCTSFFPSKNLGCFGDGGACFTKDVLLAGRLRMIMNHGARKKYFNERTGMNSRLDTIQAAILNEKLKHLEDFIERRQKSAEIYYQQLENASFLQLPGKSSCGEHTFNVFTVRVKNGRREHLKQYLEKEGIPSMIYYPWPLHKLPVFEKYDQTGVSLPVSEMLCEEVLSLPVHTELVTEEIMYITEKISNFS